MLDDSNLRAGKAPPDSNTKMVKIVLLSWKYLFENEDMDSFAAICRVILIDDHKFMEYGTI